jgi:hypothetical protein
MNKWSASSWKTDIAMLELASVTFSQKVVGDLTKKRNDGLEPSRPWSLLPVPLEGLYTIVNGLEILFSVSLVTNTEHVVCLGSR